MRTFLKHLLQAILFILLIAVTARLLRPVQLRAQEWMEDLKERTISYLEQSIGRQIEYESISPSLLLSLEIRNLTVKGASEGDKPLLTIRKVRIFYSLRKLFGKEPLKAISEIRLENSSFNLDLENDRGILAFFSDRGETGRGPGILDQITLSGKNLDVSVFYQNREGEVLPRILFPELRKGYLPVQPPGEASNQALVGAGRAHRAQYRIENYRDFGPQPIPCRGGCGPQRHIDKYRKPL
jgi:hypothetical protein